MYIFTHWQEQGVMTMTIKPLLLQRGSVKSKILPNKKQASTPSQTLTMYGTYLHVVHGKCR